MASVDFEWDAVNVKHLGRHKITPTEAEEAIALESVELGVQRHDNEERVICIGRTATGRLLTIIYTLRRGGIRVVTGYRATKRQQRVYFKGE
jgi:uncharacterized DUF497 family protein